MMRSVIAIQLLILNFINVIAEASSSENNVALKIYPLNDPELSLVKIYNLSEWYDPVAACMITFKPTVNDTYWSTLFACQRNVTAAGITSHSRYNDGFGVLPSSAFANKVRGCCCTEDLPIADRGFDEIIDGYQPELIDSNKGDNHNKRDGRVKERRPMATLMQELLARNMSIVLLGDSMNTQMFTAMVEEIRREGLIERAVNGSGVREMELVDVRYDDAVNPAWWNKQEVFDAINITRKATHQIRTRMVYRERYSNSSERHEVYLYDIGLRNLAASEENVIMKDFLHFLNLIEHPGGIYVLANIGHHMGGERSNYESQPAPLHSRVHQMLSYLQAVEEESPRSTAVFRETTPSHFNSPDRDGSFEKWQHSPMSHYDYKVPNDWDHTMYHCRAISNLSSYSSNTPENIAARRLLNVWPTSKVSILPVYKYLAPFYKMKYSHCGGYSRISVIDCVHLCNLAPNMWYPIWHEMLWTLQGKQYNYLNSAKYNGSRGGNYDNDSGFNVSAVQLIRESLIRVENSGPPGQSLLLIVGEAQEEENLDRDRRGKLYRYHHGLISPLTRASNPTEVSKLLGIEHSLPIASEVVQYFVRGQPIEVKASPNSYNGKAIRLDSRRGKEIFFVEDGKKRSIPNWDTFVAMKLDPNGITPLNKEDFESIPSGPPMPPLG